MTSAKKKRMLVTCHPNRATCELIRNLKVRVPEQKKPYIMVSMYWIDIDFRVKVEGSTPRIKIKARFFFKIKACVVIGQTAFNNQRADIVSYTRNCSQNIMGSEKKEKKTLIVGMQLPSKFASEMKNDILAKNSIYLPGFLRRLHKGQFQKYYNIRWSVFLAYRTDHESH